MKKALTDRTIKALKPAPAGRRYEVMDAIVPGFGVRVTDKGRRTFILLARFPGSRNPTRRAIADVGAISLEAGRETARDWLALLRKGIDPAIEVERQRVAQARKQENTFAAVAADYLAQKVNAGPRPQRKAKEVERDLQREFISRWAGRPITEITAHDIRQVLNEAKARGAHYQAHNLLGHVRSLFNWAISCGTYGLDQSPCERMKPKDVIGPKALRTRILSDDELRAYWRGAGRLGYPLGPLMMLLALTGQRKSEVAEAHWSEFHPELVRLLRDRKNGESIRWASVDARWKLWTIPKDRMKSESAHVVPLSEDVLKVLESLPHFDRGGFLFSTTFGEKPVNSFSKAKAALDRQVLLTLRALARTRGRSARETRLEPFVLHDVRRTMRTHLSALPIADLVRELVIAHSKPGLHRVYDQHAYTEEKRHALDLWAARLRSIVAPAAANVIPLHARA